ncbi:MAG: selenium cofactor biosynthesis protein YqeC [Bacillota bacterium]|nr:selenium cofactor biosynthesis protein YqeC [Bacillota bacterium]
MEILQLIKAFDIRPPAIVSIYGAGGKTTIAHRIARELKTSGHKAVITTTTKMSEPIGIKLFLSENTNNLLKDLSHYFQSNSIAAVGKRLLKNGKVDALDPALINELRDTLGLTVVVEADGARGFSIKGYEEYEPVLPASTDHALAVIGADSLGLTINELNVHRVKRFIESTDTDYNMTISEEIIRLTFGMMVNLGIKQVPQADFCCILNKCDLLKDEAFTLKKIVDSPGLGRWSVKLIAAEGININPAKIVIDIGSGKPVIQISCILLAAGSSTRMKADKLNMIIKSKTVLEHTLGNLANLDINELIIVTRPGSTNLPEIQGLTYRIVENHDHSQGIASSIQEGLKALQGTPQGVIIALADQPLISNEIYRKLINRYRKNLKLVTYPVYEGRKANPTIHDRRTWPDLMQLRGDNGGKQVSSRLPEKDLDIVATDDPGVSIDLDKPEDFERVRAILEK